MKRKYFAILIAVNLAIFAIGFFLFSNHIEGRIDMMQHEYPAPLPVRFINGDGKFKEDVSDLTEAAKIAAASVVQVRAKFPSQKNDSSKSEADVFIEGMLGVNPAIAPEQRASGSGVVISDDGYIITNAHVITNDKGAVAPEVSVISPGRRLYKAKVAGYDAASDVAVLKIDAKHLSYLVFSSAKSPELGEWVLAVGYPLSLQCTVTAGIISAFGRRIDMNRNVNSFIQTDAAVNYGNSGGALVNAKGELIGITSFIFTANRTYSGYSFAIPVTVVKKIANELIKNSKG